MLDVQFQPRAHRVLQRALASRRIPHAYMFAGPEGVGREMLADRLGKTLLCRSPQSCPLPPDVADVTADGHGLDACGECDDCRLVDAATHPDRFIIHRQLNREHPDSDVRKRKALQLSVDVVRHFLIERAGTRPVCGRAKVFIVREAERLSDEAQNALLKTLEEPPSDTFIILITTALDRMLPTTRSRCQQALFQPLPAAFVAERLSAMRPDRDFAETDYMARHAAGSLGAALRRLDDGLFELKRQWGSRIAEWTNPSATASTGALAEAFKSDAERLGKLASERDPDMSDTDALRVGLQTLLAVVADFYVDAQRCAAGADLPLINADQPEVIDDLVARQPPRQITAALHQIAQTDTAVTRNANIDMALETLFILLGQISRGRPVRRIANV